MVNYRFDRRPPRSARGQNKELDDRGTEGVRELLVVATVGFSNPRTSPVRQ
jgi:hypothetical protein